MLTLQPSKFQSAYLLMFKVNQDRLPHDDVILFASQGVSFIEIQEGLVVRRGSEPCVCLRFTV